MLAEKTRQIAAFKVVHRAEVELKHVVISVPSIHFRLEAEAARLEHKSGRAAREWLRVHMGRARERPIRAGRGTNLEREIFFTALREENNDKSEKHESKLQSELAAPFEGH